MASADSDEEYDGDDGPWPWEERAATLVRHAIDTVEIDKTDGSVTIQLDGVRHQFEDFDSLYQALVDEADGEMAANAPFEDGSPVFDWDADGLVEDLLHDSEIYTFFNGVRAAHENQLVLDFESLLNRQREQRVRVDLETVNAELIRYLARHPEKMRDLDPRTFEELVAELFEDMGYEVELTQRTRDGGRDLRAFRKEPYGTLLTLVECKRYGSNRTVGVGIVRSLYGVLEEERASHAVIATTAFFSKDARELEKRLRLRMSLTDFNTLSEWLKNYGGRR